MHHKYEQEFGTPGEALLAHHGVKGMKWGQTKFEALKGHLPFGKDDVPKGGKALTSAEKKKMAAEYDKNAKEIAKKQGVNPDVLKDKYGPESSQPMSNRKKAGIGAAGVGVAGAAGVGAASAASASAAAAATATAAATAAAIVGGGALAYGAHKYHFSLPPEERKLLTLLGKQAIVGPDKISEEFRAAHAVKQAALAIEKTKLDAALSEVRKLGGPDAVTKEYRLLQDFKKLEQAALDTHGPGSRIMQDLIKTTADRAYDKSSDGIRINWNRGVDIPAGGIIKRLSSVAETEARPGGFYGSHLDNDVRSYKAILPQFWYAWGKGSAVEGGYVNHYQAKQAIKAPSGKDSFRLWKELYKTDDEFVRSTMGAYAGRNATPERIKFYRQGSDRMLEHTFKQHSAKWVVDGDVATKKYFDHLRSHGYNAVIDFNDAGTLAKTPLRVLDGSMFDIVKNEWVGLPDFYDAARAWKPSLVHAFDLLVGNYVIHDQERDAALEHFGIKGMRWGHRGAGQASYAEQAQEYTRQGAVKTQSLITRAGKSAKPYQGSALTAAGAVYLHKKNHPVPAVLLGLSSFKSATGAYKTQKNT